ncbi:MAG: lipoprotein [Alphaproteobacteria bacterium]|nr:lipoprotein [Alphaproteobacteria bacterium]
MVREIPEPALSRLNRPFSAATIGALALALMLAGCGRKGPLDLPPGNYQSDSVAAPVAGGRNAAPPPKATEPDYDEDGRPIVSKGPKKRLPIDWLID